MISQLAEPGAIAGVDIRWYLGFLSRWCGIMILGIAVSSAAAFAGTTRQPDVYRATATLLIDPASLTLRGYDDFYQIQQLTQSYQRLGTNENVLQAASAALAGRYSAEELASVAVHTTAAKESQYLQVTASASRPDLAVAYDHAVVVALINYVGVLHQARFTDLIHEFQGQAQTAQASVARTSAELAALRASKDGMSPTDFA